ncbi:PQQ-binding-like beta-propeller repeat protein [Phenylobacterium sp.]|uniref:outer membrane protein assembly factor BamB family protein n=1 Tax=Phenylobacterium sp. TaxID=1871053 RepID=UPI003569A0AE
MPRHLTAALVAALAALSLAAPGGAQPPAGPPPPPTPKPGFVLPPENSAGLYPINGEPIFKARCAACHEPAVDRAPNRRELEARSPEDVYDVLTAGRMKAMAQGMSQAEIYGVVRFITGKSPTPQVAQGPDPNLCKTNGPLQPNGPQWNGWGRDLANSRYQPKPGFTAADLPRLKVKWAFAYPGTKNTEPLIFGDRLFVASLGGKAYSLDARTGCVHWRYDFKGGARASMSLGPHPKAASRYALYIGDDRMFVHALDAGSGQELWSARVDDHRVGRITGSPALYKGVLYVPLSASEESQGNVGAYGCCTFVGTVVALDAVTGKQLWKQAILDDKPHPTRKNSAGTQMYGPAGGAIWSAPTIDARRGQLYVATGDSYTEIDHPTSDAVVAMDLLTGKIRWVNQVLAKDNFMSGTVNGPLGQRGPDYDFGSSPQLVDLPGGKALLVTGNKSSIVYAMDPVSGKTLWATPKLGSGGAGGGVEWGPATDGKVLYAPLADNPARGRPGLAALDAATGKLLWQVDAPKGLPCNVPSGRCLPGYSQAATAIPGAVIAGALDGHLRAYAAADGRLIWDIDTTAPIDTVNGIKAAPGGALDMGGATIAGGMLFVHSGYNGTAGASNLLLAFSSDGR